MEIFKYPKLFYYLMGLNLLMWIIYLQLSIRKEQIITKLFDENILNKIIPPQIYTVKKIKDLLLFSAMLMMTISAGGPQWGIEFQEKQQYKGNILFLIDTSLSMSAQDLKPNRLENLKLALKSIVSSLDEYKVGLIAFQDKAYIQCPITEDVDAINYFIDILQPNMLPYPGTNIYDAIMAAYTYLSPYNGEKIVILMTDGEDHSQKLKDAFSVISKSNIKFITVGIGTPTGDLIYDPETKTYKKDKNGETVISRLDENTLIKIAQLTSGKYIRYTNPEFVSKEINDFIKKLKLSKSSEKYRTYKNRYQYFLLIAFLLILIEFIIMEGNINFPKINTRLMLLILIISCLTNLNAGIISSIIGEKGNINYKSKNYEKAYSEYLKALEKNPENEKLIFNMGNSLYKLGKYDEAEQYFLKIKDKKLKSKALFNAGNSAVKKNDTDSAIEYYKKAIIEDINNEKAKYNLQLLLKMKNQKNNKNKNDKKDKNDKNKQDKNKQNNENEKNNNNDRDNKDNQQKQNKEQSQAEKILNMIKNQEKENIKKAYSNKLNQNSFKNEYDW